MGGYSATIGLEVHAELKTATKMFCSSKNDPSEERPNVNICPVCLAHPGTLPVPNREAIAHVLKVGTAVGGQLADYTEFDRKNYFYPDLPKGYQISQYEHPLVKGGELAGVKLTRIHLEEDTANSKHRGDHSVVDFNRAGIPLMELVTEPVIHDATTASNFAKELQLLLRTLDIGEANMEKGQMRVEANISVSRDETLGTKTEVKNLNSFKSVERAIEYEIKRQVDTLESGGQLVQETRGFNEDSGETFSQRVKESSHDYRYFPDPDIPKFKLSLIGEFSKDKVTASLPELPWITRERLRSEGVPKDGVEVLLSDPIYQKTYTFAVAPIADPKVRSAVVSMLLGPVRGMNLSAEELGRVGQALPVTGQMYASHMLSSNAAIQVLKAIASTGGDPKEIAEREGLIQDSDPVTMSRIAEKLIQENADVANSIRAGKTDALKFLVGKGMKQSGGKANPKVLTEELKKLLQ